MTKPIATLRELAAELSRHPGKAPTVIETARGALGAGFHVTELKLARMTSIDCGGRTEAWTEAAMELLDGEGEAERAMPAAKLGRIIETSMRAVDGLGEAPLRVEAALGNDGIERHLMAGVSERHGRVVIALQPARAACKPALDLAASGACRPGRQSAQTCCA